MASEVVLLHGFTHTGVSWCRVTAALPGSYRAHTPDIRGHGAAGGVEPVTLAAVLSDLEALVPDRCVLVGYSMGGRLAVHAALWPSLAERVGRLVLIGGSPGLADAGERAARRAADERLAAEIAAMTIEDFAALWEQTPVLAGLSGEALAQVREDRLRSTPGGLARALRGLGTGALPSLWHRLGELRVPVRLIVGERDGKFSEIAGRMASVIPDARVQIVPRAGHAVHLEAPDAVARLIRAD